MAKVFPFQLRLKLVTADSQSGIAHNQEATIVVINPGMSKYRSVNHQAKKRAYQQLNYQAFQNIFRQLKKASVAIYRAAYDAVTKI